MIRPTSWTTSWISSAPMRHLPTNILQQLQPPPPDNQGGWMELTRIIKAFASDEEQIKTEVFWPGANSYPSHPAMPELLDGYFRKLKGQYRRPSQLAILLPESRSLRTGCLAAEGWSACSILRGAGSGHGRGCFFMTAATRKRPGPCTKRRSSRVLIWLSAR